MSYKISNGMSENELSQWLKYARKRYGTFVDGRVNYTNSEIAPIVMCTLIFNKKILIVKRGFGLSDANGYWSTVNGYIDEIKPIKDQVKQEIKEELGFEVQDNIIKVADSYILKSGKERRTYIVFACLVVLDLKPKIKLNEENTDFEWIYREQLESYYILDDLPLAVDKALALH